MSYVKRKSGNKVYNHNRVGENDLTVNIAQI